MIGRVRLVGLLALVVLGLSSCANAPEVDPLGERSTAPTIEVERASAETVDASIVRIVGFGCGAPTLGTGFAVDTDLIVTNGHIVTGRDPETLNVQRLDGTEYAATLVGFDEHLDLALLRVDDANFRPINLITKVPYVEGVAIGIRTIEEENVINEVEFTVDAPVIVNWDGVFRDTESTYRGLRINAEIRKGDSGSPLFINNNDVIGLIQSKVRRNEPRGYAVGAKEIAEFIDATDLSAEVVASRCA
jgi:S1-C subfamily serine protease